MVPAPDPAPVRSAEALVERWQRGDRDAPDLAFALLDTDDPYPLWEVMRRKAPVVWHPCAEGNGYWSVTKFSECARVLQDTSSFTSEHGTVVTALDDTAAGRVQMLATMDPPRHTVIRRLLQSYFSNATARRYGANVERFVGQLLDDRIGAGAFDLAQQLQLLPFAFAGPLMGVPADDWPELARLATAAFAPNDSTFRLDPDPALSLKRTHARILGYFAALIDERTREPRDDALGAMVAASQTREPLLTRDDVVVNCLGLLLGAVVSVPRAASALIMQLGTTGSVREDWELPANIDPLVEELLRWSSPVAYFMRVAIVDVALGGHLVRAGEPVAAWIASANRDETVYSKPDAFLVDGRRARHLACGLGPHLCIGAPIARSALATFWREVSRRNVRVRIESAPRRIRSSFLNGYKEMPVSLT